ncbi:hypothetical protein Y032_0023g860 [Ancylostoma ceylanicum]|uniref:Uncharacterized protein n=1 Tax=Ancylostoma ceylanicum TaxID=53326 RepID=A0A016V051_9BILA|nr:hypothetical protein Y032_0023g860 [Ancylostoma ceylanicum]
MYVIPLTTRKPDDDGIFKVMNKQRELKEDRFFFFFSALMYALSVSDQTYTVASKKIATFGFSSTISLKVEHGGSNFYGTVILYGGFCHPDSLYRLCLNGRHAADGSRSLATCVCSKYRLLLPRNSEIFRLVAV